MQNLPYYQTSRVVMLISVLTLSRLIPHWPNFTPVAAVALVGGSLFERRWLAVLVPVVAMIASDVVLGMVLGFPWGLHDTQLWVYGSMTAISVLGMFFRSHSAAMTSLAGGTAAGLLFFVVTNLGVWYGGTLYPQTFEGLIACYAAGVAFHRDGGNFLLNTVVSTVLFSFAAFALARVVGAGKLSDLRHA
jgi:hypothetical protein